MIGTAGVAAAVDAPKWVAALYVEQQKMVGLRWMPVPGATGYKVFRTATPGKDQQEIGSTTTPQHLDSTVEPGTTYYYSLKSVAGAELSAASDEKTVVIPGVKKSGVEAPEMDAVTLQTSTEFGKSVYKVGVLWRAKGTGAIAFNLYRSLEAGKQGEMVASSQEQRYVDVAVEPGKTYYYTVTALDAGFQETKPSAEKSIEVKAVEAAVAQKKAKKEYPKLVAIPAVKGESQKLPSDPFDAVMLDDGTIYFSAARLYRMDGFGGEVKDITPEGVAAVRNIGLGLNGEILAGVLNSPRVIVIDGTKVKEFEVPPLVKPLKNEDKVEMPLRTPAANDITQNVDGKYWVTDNPNNRIAIFDDDRAFIGNAAADTTDELIGNVTSISHDSKGNIFAASGSGNYVNIYDKDGKFIGQFGETGNIAGSFGRIGGIFVDKSDAIWVTDAFNTTVQKFDNTGKFLGALSSADGKGGLGLATPGAIALDAKGKEGFIVQGIDKSIVKITIQ
jgi:hypothetical protein